MANTKIDLLNAEAVRGAVVDPDRLAEVRDAALLDTGAEVAFDRITRLAERLLKVPVALVSIVDRDRQYFKSYVGLTGDWAERRESALTHSFCQYAVASRERFVVDDARSHPVVEGNPAIQEQGVVAYAGQPLETSSGHVIGSLCVIEPNPREWTEDELSTLGELAAIALTEIESRLRATAMQGVRRLVEDLQAPVAELGDVVRRLADRAERGEDPVVGRLATAARTRVVGVERATEALGETGRWRSGVVDVVRRPARLGDRVLQAVRVAAASVPDRAVEVDVNDRPLEIVCDAFALERALTNLLVGALQHSSGDQPVEVVTMRGGEDVVLELDSEGRAMPIAELTRLVGQLRAAVADEGNGDDGASLEAVGRTVKIAHGPVSATTGMSGTYLTLRVPGAS